MRRLVILVVAFVVGGLSLSPAGAPAPAPVLWAWERPEDLRGLDPRITVAFLSQTITIGAGDPVTVPRRQPLRVGPKTRLIAVTRIETLPRASAALDDEQVDVVAERIARTVRLPQVAAVQIDFDATASERPLYTRLLHRVRARLGAATPLSITALASWCAGDRWLEDLPIDEAVAMLFRLGPVNEPFTRIATTRHLASPVCDAIGLSLDEPIAARSQGRRVYVFNPTSWTPATVSDALEMAR